MIGDANQDMLGSVDTFKTSSAECLIEPERGPRIFVFGKDGDIGGDESTQASQHIPPTGDICITLYGGCITEVGNHRAHADSYIRLERTSRIPTKEVDPYSGHSQMDAGVVIQVFYVRRGL